MFCLENSVIEIEQQTLFDYGTLDHETRVFVQEKAQSIHARLKRTAEDVIAIGLDLIAVKNRLGYGQFDPWSQSEFEMSRRTAYRFMQVASKLGSRANLAQVTPSAIYLLAESPDEVISLVESGQILPTLHSIREAKQELSQQSPPETEHIPANNHFPDFQQWQEDNASLGLDEFGGAPLIAVPFTKEPDNDDSWTDDIPSIQPEAKPAPVYVPSLEPIIPTKSNTLTALQSSESNEWFTPAQYADAARELMNGIDIDPASNATANEVIKATTYYDIDSNGLDKPWHGRVWLNPPYGRDLAGSNQDVWSRRLLEQYRAGITTEAILLVNANTEAKWFQPLYDYLICLTNHRIKFYTNDGTPSQPTQGNALVYLGNDPQQKDRFQDIFERFGVVIERRVRGISK